MKKFLVDVVTCLFWIVRQVSSLNYSIDSIIFINPVNSFSVNSIYEARKQCADQNSILLPLHLYDLLNTTFDSVSRLRRT